MPADAASEMIDPFGRHVSYLRVSVTDRCDFRCVYCMSENMTFLPKKDILTLEELDRLCTVFVEKGVKKLRLTGGEPLVRRNIMSLFENLSRHLKTGALEELTLTTNGSRLEKYASQMVDHGVRRINVSLDTIDAKKFNLLPKFIKLSHQTMNVIKVSFIISFLYNIVGLLFAVSGNLSPIVAAILMPISSISVVLFATISTNFLAKKILY